MNKKNVIVIGGGAAGFFAAINCSQSPDIKVTILEKSSKLLSKVRVSGGGRCNVTHACFDNVNLIKNYPRGEKELRSAFSRFSTSDTINWFKQRGVELKTETDGRMFPLTDSSETIINCFLREIEKNNVSIKLNVSVEEIIKNENDTFTLKAYGGGTFECDKLIIATGGNSKKEAYNWLVKLGHSISKPVPSLFTFNMPGNDITKLMGVAVPHTKVRVTGTKLEIEGPLMITHWGMSGPAILKASAWGARILSDTNYKFTAQISWLPMHTEEKIKIEFNNQREENSSKMILSNCPFELPKRLWEHLVQKANISDTVRWADLPKKNANLLSHFLMNDEYKVDGKTTFKEEFVTCGGISLKEIDFGTMQSKIVPGLYFSGEIIDVDGVTGGFNFQNAWSTAWIAAKNII